MPQFSITSGVPQLDMLLGGLNIGDNVVWLDDSGNLASAFCLKFMAASFAAQKPLIYVSFDRSPRNLLDKLGPLAENPLLTILDCFCSGKGANSPVFLKFYEEYTNQLKCIIKRVPEPKRMDDVIDTLYAIHAALSGDVRFVFESLTGMQELWGGEESLVNFYAHSCPRLYELNTVAYWIMEKTAHTKQVRAQISQIAQVVIELSVRRGTTSLAVIKAENRSKNEIRRSYIYSEKESRIEFDYEGRPSGGIELGARIKELRSKCGMSQTQLAKMVGVTPSTISQVEGNLIYPSLPALAKMAEILTVDIGSFFLSPEARKTRVVFPGTDAMEMKNPTFPGGSLYTKLLVPIDLNPRGEPYLIEIPAEQTLASHFFSYKGQELGYVLSGELQFRIGNETHSARAGDIILLDAQNPNQWKNVGPVSAKLLWIRIKG